MTIVFGYATLVQIKAVDRLSISSTDTASDTVLEGIITACSRSIDKECSRYFYKSTATEIRYFTAKDSRRLFVGDVVSLTNLYTDTLSGDRTYPFTWTATDYDLFPYGAATNAEAEPYRWIDTAPRGTQLFPVEIAKGVKVDAVFGWPSVPTAITEACLLWSERWFKRYKTPLGVSSMTALGEMTVKAPPPDPDVMDLIQNYKLPAI